MELPLKIFICSDILGGGFFASSERSSNSDMSVRKLHITCSSFFSAQILRNVFLKCDSETNFGENDRSYKSFPNIMGDLWEMNSYIRTWSEHSRDHPEQVTCYWYHSYYITVTIYADTYSSIRTQNNETLPGTCWKFKVYYFSKLLALSMQFRNFYALFTSFARYLSKKCSEVFVRLRDVVKH